MGVGDVSVGITTNNSRQGALFDGVDDQINTTATLGEFESGGKISYSFWVKITFGQNTPIIVGTVSGGDTRNYISIIPGSNAIYGFGDASAVKEFPDDDSWHHISVVATFSTSSITKTIYVDGVAGTEVTTNRNAVSGIEPFSFGKLSTNLIGGLLSDIQMFNKILTQAEIAKLIAGRPVTNGLVHRWKLQGNYLDSVGSANGTNDGTHFEIQDDAIASVIKTARALGGATDNFMIAGMPGGQVVSTVVEET